MLSVQCYKAHRRRRPTLSTSLFQISSLFRFENHSNPGGGNSPWRVEMEVHEDQTQEEAMEKSGNQEVDENQLEDDMVEEDYGDQGEREDDEDYFPDEDSIGSEDVDTSSGSSDEEFNPSPSATTVGPPNKKLISGGKLLMQGREISEYEKIRAANIKQKEELLRTLQEEWQDFKESEGLVAGRSQKQAKELKIVEREPVKTKKMVSTAKSSDLHEVGGNVDFKQVAGHVAKKSVKGLREVLVNCQECGEEVRKTLLKTHIKFYHPTIPDASAGRGRWVSPGLFHLGR